MALESSGMILYVAKISYQSDNWFGNWLGGPKLYTHTHTHTHTQTERERHTHTDTHTHTPAAHFISLSFFKKETRLKAVC